MKMFNGADVLLIAARVLEFVREDPPNSNAGQAVDHILESVGFDTPQPWCAAFVSYIGRKVFGKAWPLPNTASCYQIGDSGKKQGILHTLPMRGDVFLLYYPKLNRFGHTGFIEEVLEDGSCRTIEGNTNRKRSREGGGVFSAVRTFGPRDRFVRVLDAIK